MKGGFEELNAKLEAATTGLGGVTRKRVFSRNTFFVDGKLFALVWREGRIGVKLPDGGAHDELGALNGATPWVAWGRPMRGWLLVPEKMHADSSALAVWVKRACESVRLAAPGPASEMATTRIEPVPAPPVVVPVVAAPAPSPAPAPAPAPARAAVAAAPAPPIVVAPVVPVIEAKKVPPAPPSKPASIPSRLPAKVVDDPVVELSEEEFSFDDPEIAAAVAAEAREAAAAESPAVANAEDANEFSFDAPEAGAGAASVGGQESSEFDFGGGGEPEPPAATAATNESGGKKKKGKGRKKTG
jgi:hypothetical protein